MLRQNGSEDTGGLQDDVQKESGSRSREVEVEAAASNDTAPWQNRCRCLGDRLGSLLTQKLWTDCELLIGPNQVHVNVHRAVLGAASPVLAAMLFSSLAQQPLAIPNIEPDIFNHVLKYIYTDNINIETIEIACQLHSAAHYLDIPQLEAVCKTYLLNNIPSNCIMQLWQVFQLAQLFDENEIKAKCLEVMSEDAEQILRSESLEKAPVEMLQLMFSQERLRIESDLELVSAAERWVCENTNRIIMNLLHERNETENSADPTLMIRDAVKEIRFLSLTPKDMSEHDMSSLLMESDTLAIIMNILNPKTDIPMPKGFSTCNETRTAEKNYVIIHKSAVYDRDILVGVETAALKIKWFLMVRNNDVYSLCPADGLFRVKKVYPSLKKICAYLVNHKPGEKNMALAQHSGFSEQVSLTYKTKRQAVGFVLLPTGMAWIDVINPDRGYCRDGLLTVEVISY